MERTQHRDNPEGTIKRYSHQEVEIEHNEEIKAKITVSGRVIITKPVPGTDEIDEIDIPASLIFRIGSLLRNTRKISYLAIGDVKTTQG